MDQNRFHILILDRNPNVRDFLQREFRRLGFHADAARDEAEVAAAMERDRDVPLVVLDPEAPGLRRTFFERLARRHPAVPIVIHMFSPGEREQTLYRQAAAIVEKDGSIETLVQAVQKVLESRETSGAALSSDAVVPPVPGV